MTHPSEVHGRRLAIVVWGVKPDGSDEVAVCVGTVEWDEQHLDLVGDSGDVLLSLQHEWLDRLRHVEESLKETLQGADLCLSLSIGPVPQDADMTKLVKTGLRWPVDDAS